MENCNEQKYFEVIKLISLLAYIMLGFWHMGHIDLCLYVGVVLSIVQFVMCGMLLLKSGRFRLLNPQGHKVTIFMSLLILVIYLLELWLK